MIVPTTGQEDIFDYALRVGEKWQLGSSKRDNGLLIAVAINDHRIQILTGYGLEGYYLILLQVGLFEIKLHLILNKPNMHKD